MRGRHQIQARVTLVLYSAPPPWLVRRMMDNTTQPKSVESEYSSDIEIGSATATSEYGSDIDFSGIDEDVLLADMLTTLNGAAAVSKRVILPNVEFEEGELEDEENNADGAVEIHQSTRLRVPRSEQHSVQNSSAQRQNTLEMDYYERSRRAWCVPVKETKAPDPGMSHKSKQASPPTTTVDVRSPIEKFRTKPKKPLSVTDLVSPAWCELQYLYTLTKFGRKPRTQAMRTGSKIHQQLEDEVHATVPVQVCSSEDRFGLRLWNMVSGLRCLRETGLTRELEIWGVIEGQVVNGVIDQLSYTNPEEVCEGSGDGGAHETRAGGDESMTNNQPGILQAFELSPGFQSATIDPGQPRGSRQIYITDVKTRSVLSVPASASMRPTWMQLMLYHKILKAMSLNEVDAEMIFARYNLQPLASFTETFLSEIGEAGPQNEAGRYPNLLSLWSLLVSEMQEMALGRRLSPILRAEFRYSRSGDLIGSRRTKYDANTIEKYITDEMLWWNGGRAAKGVEVNEAFKCRICDFAEECGWRATKIDEATEKSRLRKQSREKSTV